MVHQSKNTPLIIRSSIKPQLMRQTLKRGGWIAAFGALIIIFGGSFLPLPLLKIGGIPLFLSGLILIAVGWLPYRKLQRLELKPHLIQFDGSTFIFLQEGKPLFKIPKKSIDQIKYVEKERLYGIAIWLKKPVKEKIGVLQARFNFEAFIIQSSRQFEGCDLFFPYFSASKLKDLLE